MIQALRAAALVALATAMLLWPVLLNGRPAVFTDTALYYSEGEYLGEALGLVQPGRGGLPPGDPTRLPDRPGLPNVSADIDGGRSAVWGGLFYALQRIGGVGLVAAVQAACVTLPLYLLYRAALPRARRVGYLAVAAALAVATALPIFTTLMMPDVFAGVAAVSLAALVVFWARLSPVRRATLLILLALSSATHGSIPLIGVAGAAIGTALLSSGELPGRLARLGAALAAVAVGVVGLRLADLPIQQRAGETLGSPPFLTARLLADGPGRAYLRQVCHGRTPYIACGFATRPNNDSDVILWSHRPIDGVFSVLPAGGRRRMEAEDLRFAEGAVLAHPLGEAGAALKDAGEQMVLMGVDDSLRDQGYFVTDGYWRRTSLAGIIPDGRACTGVERCGSRIPPVALDVWQETAALAALAFLAWRLSRPDLRGAWRGDAGEPSDLARLAALLVILTVLNAGICGALSGPFPRYQARLAWIDPLAALLLLQGASAPTRRKKLRICKGLVATTDALDAPPTPL
jgi:hypothetical protein